MVSFNVYRSTTSGFYVEGVCLVTDEKPVVGIANGSILYAVDTTSGETTRYMYDQNSMSWIEAACPCGGGSGSGSGGGDSGGGAAPLLVHEVPSSERNVLDTDFNTIKAAVEAGRSVFLEVTGSSAGDEINGFYWAPLSQIKHAVSTSGLDSGPYYGVFFEKGAKSWVEFSGSSPDRLTKGVS